ncbi:hypothetical protein TIFTF001_009644 [Ficus carica]|uniref:Uncharacterized protein n=1 Tax=Ficus carica TaxID=3494 RepID=A0AA87ZVC5_FICCA|nr:hypothetical protein TIFTF001_009644 [Ficus carica]
MLNHIAAGIECSSPVARKGGNHSVVAKSPSSHLIVVFALRMLHKKEITLDAYKDVLSTSLKCLAPLVRLPLPPIGSEGDKMKRAVFDLVQNMNIQVKERLCLKCFPQDKDLRYMTCTVVKLFISRISTCSVRIIMDCGISWCTGDSTQLWSAAAQVPALQVENVEVGFARHVNSVLQSVRSIFESAISRSGDYSDEDTPPFWKKECYSMVMLEKTLQRGAFGNADTCGAWLSSACAIRCWVKSCNKRNPRTPEGSGNRSQRGAVSPISRPLPASPESTRSPCMASTKMAEASML